VRTLAYLGNGCTYAVVINLSIGSQITSLLSKKVWSHLASAGGLQLYIPLLQSSSLLNWQVPFLNLLHAFNKLQVS
jgi:hypothetical protein